jgi:hypothetical protein
MDGDPRPSALANAYRLPSGAKADVHPSETRAGRIIRTASMPGFHVLGYSPTDHHHYRQAPRRRPPHDASSRFRAWNAIA